MSKSILVLGLAASLLCCQASSILGATLVSGFEDGSMAGWSICGWGGRTDNHTLDTNALGNNSAKGLTLSINTPSSGESWIFAGFQYALTDNLSFENCTQLSFDIRSSGVNNALFRAYLADGSEWRWYGNNFPVSNQWTTYVVVPQAFWQINGPAGSTFTNLEQVRGLWIDTDIGMVGNAPLSMEVDNLIVDGTVHNTQAVPEPMSIVLGLMGLGSIAGYRKIRK